MRWDAVADEIAVGGAGDGTAHATAAAIEIPVDTVAQDPLGGRGTVVGSVDPDKAATMDARGRLRPVVARAVVASTRPQPRKPFRLVVTQPGSLCDSNGATE